MAHRSFSAVSTLRKCGEQYRLERVANAPQRPTTAQIAGRVVHQATELVDYEIAAGETSEEALAYSALRLADDTLDKEVESALSPRYPRVEDFRSYGQSKSNPAGQDINWFRKTGIPGSISNYIRWRMETVPHYELMVLPDGQLAIEVYFTMKLGEVEVVGQIDRVFIDTKLGLSVVLDIKNGGKPKSNEQLGLYREAMLEINPEGGPYFGSFLYGLKPGSKNGVQQTFPSGMPSWTRDSLTNLYVSADKQIRDEIFLPNPGDACFMCNVSEYCPFYSASKV